MAQPSYRVKTGSRDLRVANVSWETRGLVSWASEWKTRLIKRVLDRREGALVDVGANIGQTLLDYVASGSSAPYLGFEPNSLCIEQVQRVILDNALERATVVPTGLSDSWGIVPLYVSASTRASADATMVAGIAPGSAKVALTVAVCPFDEVELPEAKGPLALIKIDIEGHELAALKGMAKTLARSRPWVLCEVLHRDSQADPFSYRERIEGISAFLAEAGYAILRIERTADDDDVLRLVPCEGFPDTVYVTGVSQRLCDYLFVPADQDIADVSRTVVG